METTKTLLQHCIYMLAILHFVTDSLDEFKREERNFLLRVLLSIIARPDSIAKPFLGGQGSILSDIRSGFPNSYQKSTDCGEVQVDIEAYPRGNIALRQQGKYLVGEPLILEDPAMAQEVIKALSNGASGM